MRWMLAMVMAGTLVAARTSQGQPDSGSRVRVTFRSAVERGGHLESIRTARRLGTAVARRGDTLDVELEGRIHGDAPAAATVAVPVVDVEVARRKRFGVVKGGLLGALMGAAIGVGATIVHPRSRREEFGQPYDGIYVGTVGAALGTVVGGIVGFCKRVDVWVPLV